MAETQRETCEGKAQFDVRSPETRDTLLLNATVFEEDRLSGRIIGIAEVAQADADQTVELLRVEMYTLSQGQCNFRSVVRRMMAVRPEYNLRVRMLNSLVFSLRTTVP
jgi:predicted membrane protein